MKQTPEVVDLKGSERKVFSQFGEDGVIERIFEVIEPTSKYAVEFGASDGVRGSNVRNLFLNQGWSGLLLEGDPEKAKTLAQNYRDLPQVKSRQAWVWPGNVELLFEDNGVPADLDFLVIDVDSNDYYLWRAIRDFRPKVVMIEVNGLFPPPERRVVDFHPMNYWDQSAYFGASLQSLYDLAKRKGYELVYHTKSGLNAFFVDEKYFPLFGIEDNSPESLYHPLNPLYHTAWLGPDGELIPPDKKELAWKDLRIEKNFVER